MTLYGWPAIYALFVWWFSTALIIFLDGLPPRTFRWSMLGATALFALSFWGISATAHDTSVRGTYAAFTYALLAWGWLEVSFYMGYVTGPRTHACEHGCKGWRHFGHALQASIYHEVAILAKGVAVVALTWGAPNQVAVWTFCVLWWMHESARLNVLLGVPNINEQLLPPHLKYLGSFLARKSMNMLFPLSVTVSTVVCVILFQRATAPGVSPATASGTTFVAVMMALAILEHWFLVMPLPTAWMWEWSLRARSRPRPRILRPLTRPIRPSIAVPIPSTSS